MTDVYFHVAWENESNEAFRRRIAKQTPNCDGQWESIKAVADPEEADHHVSFNQPDKTLSSEKLLLFCKEPPHNDGCAGWHDANAAGKFPIESYYKPQDWFLDKTYGDLNTDSSPTKTKPLSWVTSDKGRHLHEGLKSLRRLVMKTRFRKYEQKGISLLDRGPSDGHILRMDFLNKLTDNDPNYLDLYGRGDFSGPYYCGELPDHFDKWGGLADYRYTLAIENYRGPNYFSEKITDALLAWCMPIYWGCTNLSEFLPEDSYVEIDIEREGAERVREIINSNRREKNIDAIAEARQRLLNEYQIWPTVDKAVTRWL